MTCTEYTDSFILSLWTIIEWSLNKAQYNMKRES